MSVKNTMSVQAFVKETLEQIHEGMVGKEIPATYVDIKFEIGVCLSKSKTSETKGGLELSVASVLSLAAGGKSENNGGETAYNKLTFTIPLRLRNSLNEETVKSIFNDAY